jgi:transmembrane sensor
MATADRQPPTPFHPPGPTGADAPPFAALQQAAEWFALLRAGQADAQDQADWRAWLLAHADHARAWQYVDRVSASFEPAQASPDTRLAVAALRKLRDKPLSRRQFLARAGLAAGAGLLGWGAWRHTPAPDVLAAWTADFHTATGEMRDLTLADGTRVWLNTASAVDVDYQPGLRRLRLRRGEILVQTAADSARPLVVDSDHGRLRALGTRFSVRQEIDSTRVAVYQGAVEVRPTRRDALQRVDSGQMTRFSADAIDALAPADRAREAWSRGVLLAEDITLAALVSELRRYRRGYLGLDPKLGSLRVMGAFPLSDPEQALEMLEGVLPIRVRHRFPGWTTIEARADSPAS